MLKWLTVAAVVVVGAAVFLSGRLNALDPLSVAYQQRYWTKQAPKVLGPAWRVTSVKEVAAPASWRQTTGGGGIEVRFDAPGVTIQDEMIGPYHPQAALYFMPPDWEGACRIEGHDEMVLTKAGYREERTPQSMKVQVYPLSTYLGRTWRYHLFCSSAADGDGIDWERVEKTLGVRVERKPSRIALARAPSP